MTRQAQMNLFASVPPYQQHSETSREASKLIEPAAGTLRYKVLEYLRERRFTGATDEQMQDALSMPASTQRPRRIELWRAGLIYERGIARKTASGRNATVWFPT